MKAVKMPSGKYRVEAYIGHDSSGKKIRKIFTDADQKRALRKAHDFVDEHREAFNSESVKALLRKYIEYREPVLSPSTIKGYVQIENYLNKTYHSFTELRAYSISIIDAQNLVNAISETHSPKTVRSMISLITSALKFASIPFPLVRLPEKVRPALNIPDEITMARIIKLSKGTVLEIPILLAATGPLRRGEISALTIDDIKGNVVHVCKDMVLDKDYVWRVKTPKNYSSDRFIELPQYVIDLINKQGYITRLNPGNITDRFRTFLKKNEIPPFRFHDIRHYCVSMLKARNIPDIYIQQRGGWSTDSVMKNVYTHTLQNQSKIQTEIMIKEFEKIIEK